VTQYSEVLVFKMKVAAYWMPRLRGA
jgi:hypothetical protein